MDLYRDETLVILGRSGAGKSVLLKCLTNLMEPDSGDITVLGRDILNLKEEEMNELRSHVGFLFQSGALYDSMTLKENLLFPLKRNKYLEESDNDKVTENALESVNLKEARDKMPSELSGGMRKRAGLARTLVMNPEIILYDEPTTGLDPFTSVEISELIVSVQKEHGNSGIVVTHDMKCAEIVADRMIIIDEGKNIAEGTFNELQKSKDERIKHFFQ
jgi:phospholipid/cholesterol/gamma-HCH transport system ATP-binding protein